MSNNIIIKTGYTAVSCFPALLDLTHMYVAAADMEKCARDTSCPSPLYILYICYIST